MTVRLEYGDAYDADLVDDQPTGAVSTSMIDPPDRGRSVRENCLEQLGLSVTATVRVRGVVRHSLSRVLDGRAGGSSEVALRFEKTGWSDAEFWLRRQITYDLVQARRQGDLPGAQPDRPQLQNPAHLNRNPVHLNKHWLPPDAAPRRRRVVRAHRALFPIVRVSVPPSRSRTAAGRGVVKPEFVGSGGHAHRVHGLRTAVGAGQNP